MGIPGASAVIDRTGMVPLRSVARYLLIARLVIVAACVTSPFWLAALFFTSPQDYSITSSLICVPLLTVLGLASVAYFSRHDPYLRRILFAGLIAHMAASSLFIWIGFRIYGGIADAFHYWTVGLQQAKDFQIVGWDVFHGPYWSTNLINTICGLATLLIGDALPALFIAFALISLAGAYLFYRAFTIAFPNGDHWLFGLLVVLSPSILFWASSVGKDALMQYFLALACLGFAQVLQGRSPRGALCCVIGVAGTFLIRAHIAAMLAIGMTLPYAAGNSKPGRSSKVARIVLIPLLLVGTYFVIKNAGQMIYLAADSSASMTEEANNVTRYSQVGGSSFNQGKSLPMRILESPLLIVRPFPWEMHSFMAIAPGIESTAWILICLLRRRQIWLTLKNWRDPYVSFLLAFAIVFVCAFGGAISNFGILSRQRIMVTPFLMMLVCSRQKKKHCLMRGRGELVRRWIPKEILSAGS